MQVARTILEQIKATIPKSVYWSWGSSKFQSVSDNQISGVGAYLGGLLFYVRGHKHKGHVFVTLAYNDTYTISIGHYRKGNFNALKQFKDVYSDQVGTIIDESIERQPEYAF